MKTIIITLALLFGGILISGSTLFAQDHDNHEIRVKHAKTNEHHKHHLAMVNGGTSNFSHATNAVTTGLDYEYRFSNFVGAGIFTEIVFLHSNEIEIGIPIFFHPIKGLKLIADPLIAFTKETKEAGHGVTSDGDGSKNSEANFHFRIGAGYDFHVSKLSIGPEINVDFSDTQALVYGLSIGYGF